MTLSWVAPVACTLPTSEQPLRVAEFDNLFERHLVRVESQGRTKATLVLSGPEALDASVRDLAARESSCCSFFDFTVTAVPPEGPGRVGVCLQVEVPPAHADVLAALIERAESARDGDAHVH